MNYIITFTTGEPKSQLIEDVSRVEAEDEHIRFFLREELNFCYEFHYTKLSKIESVKFW